MSHPTLPLPAPRLPRSQLWQKTGTIVSPAPERLQHQQGGGLKLAVVGLTPDSPPRRIEEDCVPLLAPRLRLDIGSESRFLALKLPGCLFSLQPCPPGPGAR